MTIPPKQVVISREQAVFWLDRHGYWHNRHGKFKHKKIIDFFHASIQRDEEGYYLTQQRGNVHEKVYFPFEDTALFVFDILENTSRYLVLNTGRRLRLDPERLYVQADQLYTTDGDERIKFSERSLFKMASYIRYANGQYSLELDGRRIPIRQL